MNTFTKFLTASALLVAFAAPASAAISSDLDQDIRSAVGNIGNVTYRVNGDTVILNGFVKDHATRNRIVQAAKDAGAERVINSVQAPNK